MTPLARDALVDAEALEDLEALLRIADAARRGAAHADGVVLVEQHHRHAAQRQVAGERQAGQAAADDHDRVARGLAPSSSGGGEGKTGSS